jgi:ABC-type uncharacterized transport system substrate-binding protein
MRVNRESRRSILWTVISMVRSLFPFDRYMLSVAGGLRILLWAGLALGAVWLAGCGGGPAPESGLVPTPNSGQKWRIGYYEGGPYVNYQLNLREIANGLAELGWMQEIDIPEFDDPDDTSNLWGFLSENVESKYIEFVADAYWSADWDDDLRMAVGKDAIHRLSVDRDIDLVIAAGTWAGKDLANNEHSVPTMIVSCSDPIGSGIIESAEDSGFDHVLAKCDPGRYVRQVRVFHDIFDFEKLGVVYEDTEDGRAYANLDALQQVAEERGFELVECHARDTGLTDDECLDGVSGCLKKLAPEIDAFWVSDHNGFSTKYMPGVLEPLFEYDIPTWSTLGADTVKYGVLMSIAASGYHDIGLWYAENMAKIFNGAKPRDLNQVFEDPNVVAINLETANRIGYEPPQSILDIADIVYDTIYRGE